MSQVIAHFEIRNPPTKFVEKYKRPKEDERGKIITEKVFYLNNGIFFGNNLHWADQYKVINYAKDWLLPFLQHLPKILQCQIEIIYYYPSDQWDLDNRDSFWRKILLDVLKTPTEKQKLKAAEYNSYVRSVEKLPDDTVRFVNALSSKFQRGENMLEIKITGELLDEQQELF